MRHGRLHRPARFADGGQYGRDTGADIGTKCQRDTGRQRDQPLCRHDDDYARCRGGGLDQAGERRGDKNAHQRIFHGGHHIEEGLKGTQRLHRVAHHAHAEEHQAQTHQHHTPMLDLLVAAHHQHAEAARHHNQRILRDLEGDDLRGDGGADIRPEDNAYCLRQAHQPGGHKTDHNNRGNRGGLDHGCHPRTGQHTCNPVACQLLQDHLHPVAGQHLQ